MSGGTSSGVEATTETIKKKGRLPRLPRWLLIVLAIVILGGVGVGVRFFVFKPQPEETAVASTSVSPSNPTDVEAPTMKDAAAPAAMKPDDGGSRTGTVVRAGMRGCGVNRSHVFMIAFPEGEKELRLSGVDSFHYGPITQRADDMAHNLMAGKRVIVAALEEDFFRIKGVAALADGRDMAVVLAEAGLVQQADGASEEVIAACKKAQAAKRGIYALL